MEYAIDHIGYLTRSIEDTAKQFKVLGYTAGDIFDDHTQRTRICFLSRGDEPRIELVEPFEDNLPMRNLLAKTGVAPYHLCYQVDNIEKEYEKLMDQNWTPLFKPVEATAFGGRKICYFSNRKIGFIELVNKS